MTSKFLFTKSNHENFMSGQIEKPKTDKSQLFSTDKENWKTKPRSYVGEKRKINNFGIDFFQ